MKRGPLIALMCAVVVLGAGPLAFAQSDASADFECSSYGAQASATGVRTRVAADNLLPLTNAVEAAGPAASALVAPGVSSGFAGAPYPGDTALSGISLVGGVSRDNGGPNFDSNVYPLVAQSQFPTTPSAKVEQPAVTLESTSAELSSTATATDGGSSAGNSTATGSSVSVADAGCSPDGLVANADTDDQAVSVQGDVLRISRIHSEAHALAGTDGTPVVHGHLDVAQMTVAGQTVELSEDNPGQAAQLPESAAGVLRNAGITVRYLAAVPDGDGRGVSAPGLEIDMTVAANSAGLGTSPTTTTMTFGRAYARVDGAVTAIAGADSALTSSGTVGPNGTVTAGSGAHAAPNSPSTPSPASSPARRAATVAGITLPEIDWKLVYVAVAMGAAVLIGGGQLVRMLGERLRWM